MAEIIHMSQQFCVGAGMGAWGKDGVLSALPHLSTVETVFTITPQVCDRASCA